MFVRVSVVAFHTKVSVAAGSVRVVVPATAVACTVVVPEVEPSNLTVLVYVSFQPIASLPKSSVLSVSEINEVLMATATRLSKAAVAQLHAASCQVADVLEVAVRTCHVVGAVAELTSTTVVALFKASVFPEVQDTLVWSQVLVQLLIQVISVVKATVPLASGKAIFLNPVVVPPSIEVPDPLLN